MPGSEFRYGAVQVSGGVLNVRWLLTVLVMIVFILSFQIASFHHHDDRIAIHRACHICVFLASSSAGSEADLPLITPTGSAPLFLALDNLLIFLAVLPLFMDTRAPPPVPEITGAQLF